MNKIEPCTQEGCQGSMFIAQKEENSTESVIQLTIYKCNVCGYEENIKKRTMTSGPMDPHSIKL